MPPVTAGAGKRPNTAAAAEERTRYLMMGALMVAVDAAIGKPEPEKVTA
jgi:hypothetical protein